jgi:diguanylate cyclase (GGDEF)-like protein
MLVPIDGRSLLLAKGAIVLAAGIGMALSALHLRQFRSLRLWAIGFLLMGLGGIGEAERGLISPWIAVIGSAILLMAGSALLPVAMADDCGQRIDIRLVAAVPLCAILLLFYGWFVQPNLSLRIFTIRGCLASMLLSTAWLLWRQIRQERLGALNLYTFLPLLLLGLNHAVAAGDEAWHMLRGGVSHMTEIAVDLDRPINMQLGAMLWWMISSVAFLFGLLLRVTVRLNEEVQRQADIDHLTGIYTRRAFMRLAEEAILLHRRSGQPITLLFLDLDHFKRLNDQYGHQAGDAALAHFARLMQGAVRHSDLVGRYGGEEFCLLLPGALPALARQTAERICAALRETPFRFGQHAIPLTVSVGIAPRHPEESFDSLIRRADVALYEAKRSGRDRIAQAA